MLEKVSETPSVTKHQLESAVHKDFGALLLSSHTHMHTLTNTSGHLVGFPQSVIMLKHVQSIKLQGRVVGWGPV